MDHGEASGLGKGKVEQVEDLLGRLNLQEDEQDDFILEEAVICDLHGILQKR
jgi:hypothetical protein